MKRIQHLKDGFRYVLFNGDAGAECSRAFGGIEDNCRQVSLQSALIQSCRDLAHHRDVENVQRRPRERNARHAIFDSEFDVLEFFHLIGIWMIDQNSS